MEMINDYEVMVAQGLPSPYITSDYAASPLAQRSMLTHWIFPGLAGFVPVGAEHVVVIFVDKLPSDENLRGSLRLTASLDASGEPIEKWLVQPESAQEAWQFKTIDSDLSLPASTIVLCQWKPHALASAYSLHHKMIAALGEDEHVWLIGSELEKEAYSEFVLSTGHSSLVHPLESLGLITKALAHVGQKIVFNNSDELLSVPCLAMQAYPIRWYTES
ncbi:hypothetical protein [Pseudomonas serbica]|uniref:hypothetical protein n=1 Tax=Pseudomonas serbica TaxID=2965074 RepID=UPI00237ADADB|nr:hypothetical protein [Pseudomonas serbica]